MTDLSALRTQIDNLDDQIHDLLMRRFEVTAQVSAAKGAATDPTLIPRPQREQAILTRLKAQHKGDLPASSLVRIWKEIMGAACHQQGDFRVGVATEPFGVLALAVRDHFGTAVGLQFGALEALAQDLKDRQLALVVATREAAIPEGLYEIGQVEAEGVHVGRLLSPNAPKT